MHISRIRVLVGTAIAVAIIIGIPKFLSGALDVVLPHDAIAAKPTCQANGSECRNNQGCCSRNCAKAPRAKSGTCCTPTGNDDTTCNNRDDDCNGLVDDGFVPLATLCGVGACERTGNLVCVGGVTQDTCVPGAAESERCDGIDNDCDGAIDEDLGQETCGSGDCAGTTDNCVNGEPQTCTPAPDGAPCDDGNPGTVGDVCLGGECTGTACPAACVSAMDQFASIAGPYQQLECGYDAVRSAGFVYFTALQGQCDLPGVIDIRSGMCNVVGDKTAFFQVSLALTNAEQAACASYAAAVAATVCSGSDCPRQCDLTGTVCPAACVSAMDQFASIAGPYQQLQCGYDAARSAGFVYFTAAPGSCDVPGWIDIRSGMCNVVGDKTAFFDVSVALNNAQQANCAPYAAEIAATVCSGPDCPRPCDLSPP